jgi:putative membrane protein
MRQWNFRLPVSAALIATAVIVAGAQTMAPPPAPTAGVPAPTAVPSTQGFVTRAAVSDLFEISSSRLAEERSPNPQIREFAARMIHDHGQTTAELRAIVARQPGLRLPPALDAMHRGMIEQLRTVGPRQFISLYAQQQIQGHEDAVALFAGYAMHGSDPPLVRFARETLPVIQHHLMMARRLPSGNGMTAQGR